MVSSFLEYKSSPNHFYPQLRPLAHLPSISLVFVKALRLTLYQWDDIIAFLVFTPLFYSFVSFYLLPQKQEPGFGQFYAKPQEALGLLNAQKAGEASRDIAVRL